MSLTDDFHDKADTRERAETRRAVNYADLQDEIAGRSTGRQKRFLVSGEAASGNSGDGKRDGSKLSALELLLLTDPIYAALYHETLDSLADVEAVAESALNEALAAMDEARTGLNDILESAARLPGGKRVFPYSDGTVRDEDGNIIDSETAKGIVWPEGQRSGEAYEVARNRVHDLQATVDRLQKIQIEMGGIRVELEDSQNPASPERVHDLKEAAEQAQDEIEEQLLPAIRTKPEMHKPESAPVKSGGFDTKAPAV